MIGATGVVGSSPTEGAFRLIFQAPNPLRYLSLTDQHLRSSNINWDLCQSKSMQAMEQGAQTAQETLVIAAMDAKLIK